MGFSNNLLSPFNALSDGFGFVPQPPSPLNSLASLLSGVSAKPRTRSEWEARFSHWQKPASDTEEKKIDAAANRIRLALRRSEFLPTRSWSIVKQGSYHNNTNVRQESDIDLGVCLDDAFFVEGPQSDWPSNTELGRISLPFEFKAYKNHIAWCLEQEFGYGTVTLGEKAIHLHENSREKINADIVPAFTFQRFGPRIAPYWQRGLPDTGIALLTDKNVRITNFPAQHYANGCAKNERTGRRYKRVARILKRLRSHMAENYSLSTKTRQCAERTASYLIESLVYNCPDQLFGNTSIYDDVVSALNHLFVGLSDTQTGTTILTMPRWAFWYEVNGLKPLFASGQAWRIEDALEFVYAARSYVAV
jgi:hypothetical protein